MLSRHSAPLRPTSIPQGSRSPSRSAPPATHRALFPLRRSPPAVVLRAPGEAPPCRPGPPIGSPPPERPLLSGAPRSRVQKQIAVLDARSASPVQVTRSTSVLDTVCNECPIRFQDSRPISNSARIQSHSRRLLVSKHNACGCPGFAYKTSRIVSGSLFEVVAAAPRSRSRPAMRRCRGE